MDYTVMPAKNVAGELRLPGDKSISHRYAMLGAIAEGMTILRNYAPGADCASTLRCLEGLGVKTERRPFASERGESPQELVIEGRGLKGLQPPSSVLDAGNSGSTMRMLSGLLAGHPFQSSITGDNSLQRRPMRRIMDPLGQMGARIEGRNGDLPPLTIRGGDLRGIHYSLPVPSAQVKSAVLLAGLLAQGETTVEEPAPLRDHTEIALAQFGAGLTRFNGRASVIGGRELRAQQFDIPGDISSAAFFLCAALPFHGSDLLLRNVGVNPTRAAVIDFLRSLGAKIELLNVGESAGERVADIHLTGGPLRGGKIAGASVAGLIDEIPVLAVLATQSQEGLIVRDAQELRVKETDRIGAVAENLQRMGASVEIYPDGLDVAGRQALRGAELNSFGDHRIAMAFAVAALGAQGLSSATPTPPLSPFLTSIPRWNKSSNDSDLRSSFSANRIRRRRSFFLLDSFQHK
jgi:3-phosphoshikimate 1-carboxyvinyltransferase